MGEIAMRLPTLSLALALALVWFPATTTHAADIKVLAGGGIAAPLNEIKAEFEKTTGHNVTIHYDTAPNLMALSTAPDPFDLGIVPHVVMTDTLARARFAPGAMSTVARVGIGVAVRVGAPKPDISTPEALKQALLNAKSVASIPASATGGLLAEIYERLGIGEAMKAKTKAQTATGGIADSVASGESELAVFITNVITDPRLDVVGPFPAELQREIVYTGATAATPKEPDAAKAFLAYILSPPSQAILKARGMTPGL
jgi:molybdate transport system substrate-binding protein